MKYCWVSTIIVVAMLLAEIRGEEPERTDDSFREIQVLIDALKDKDQSYPFTAQSSRFRPFQVDGVDDTIDALLSSL